MIRIHNPAHPGEVLREFLGDITVTEAAHRLHVTRVSLSRILNGTNGISADMAMRLAKALSTSAEMWVNLQAQYDLWMASKRKQPKVLPIRTADAA